MTDKTSENVNGHDHSPTQPRTNRATGPRTAEGKKRSSLNALRHGLTGHVIVLPGEDLAAYQQHCQQAFDRFQPADWEEKHLVQTLVDLTWKLHRLSATEENLLTLGTILYPGISEDPQVQDALAMARMMQAESHTFGNFSLYRQRLSRERERTQKQLLELQAKRKEQESADMNKAGDLLQMHRDKGEPYQPAEDGFVFSNPEIETYIRREGRLKAARRAAWNRA